MHVRAYGKAGIRHPEMDPEMDPESGIRNPESGIRNPVSGTRQINERFKLRNMIDINTPPPFSAFLTRWMIIYGAPF